MKYCLLLLLFFSLTLNGWSQKKWQGGYRGFNVSPFLKESDIEHLHQLKVNIIRVSFQQEPLINKTPPYDYNEQAFTDLNNIISSCKKYNINVVIDPHTAPGMKLDPTTTYKDPFWHDEKFQTLFINLWKKLSDIYKNNETVLGYDLLNEPGTEPDFVDRGVGSWFLLSSKLVKLIRQNTDNHTIIIETAAGSLNKVWLNRVEGIKMLKLPPDDNLVVSPHVYLPPEFTGQQENPETRFVYPGVINGIYWDKTRLEEGIKPIIQFQNAHKNVPILIGEFGVSKYAGPSANQYIKDMVDIFEKYHFSWAYHAYRATSPKTAKLGRWEVEASLEDTSDNKRNENSSRIQILKEYFQKNQFPQ